MSAVFLLLSGFTWGLFCYNKGVLMQKVSYMGNGTSKEFYFNFPYFENSNIVVTVNNRSAPTYSVVGTSGGLDADIPYTGGKIVFETAPSSLDSITIARHLSLSRIVDYQPLAKIEPTLLNQDMNYMMEVLKDLQDELDSFRTQYADISDKESTTTLLARIAAISEEITAVNAQIIALGDVSTIRSNITTLDTRTTGLYDYVIESQAPTVENNYTWYRKYKSGWIEQGGIAKMQATTNQWMGITVEFPKQMANNLYTATGTAYGLDSVSTLLVCIGGINSNNEDNGTGKTTTNMFIQTEALYGDAVSRVRWINWQVSGVAA